MNHLIVYAHPNPNSYNHAILETTVNTLKENGHEVSVRDLYALNFEPVLRFEGKGEVPPDIKTEQEFITKADVITFIYPIWWTGLPAILKGYVDRVYSYGFAYEYAEDGTINKLLSGKKGLIINTYGTPKEIYDSIGMTESLKKTSTTGIFEFCGIESVGHVLFGSVPQVDDATRKGMLDEVKTKLNSLFAPMVTV
ncbi:NAD(P)H-dependent oxidoreductase [Bacillus sp. ISL-40]|uniref:NAD(P)H-dependent oxidoreductase n=1 Tax=unclassified Bacillus (in: firmicutes) TaxID=185979 RepID=UPI001BE96929|nr:MULTISPECIES: NAD(P)H-dependent oxidoreductase [unclassified Bacillus (in: firmicutes)]MBT2695949.1 NAD(P)H-dependent oxidoreductase [Bacillus sp. ISL-40]MBT2739695.1 NAD(P)H-dependent oxidoreductase [Bacillus sp. ISL-77]